MIALTVYGDPAACRAAAEEGSRAARAVEDQAATRGRTTCGSWDGAAAEAYRDRVDDAYHGLVDVLDRITPACRALEDLAGELDVVKSRMADVRAQAVGAGLQVSGDHIHPPDEGGQEMAPAAADAHDVKVQTYHEAFAAAEDARTKEREAHERVTSAMRASTGDGMVENLLERLGVAPPDNARLLAGSATALGTGLLATGGLATWMSHGVYGMWQPRFRNASGTWVWGTNKGWSRGQRLRLAMRRRSDVRDFRARPGKSAPRGRWVRAGKFASRAGGVLTALTAGWDQWQQDADDPALDTGERIDRAATSASGSALGGWGGAAAGSAIGTALCPGVGTAVGGVVGGAIGAYTGSEVADVFNKQWDGAVHAAGDLVESTGDMASEALDTTGELASDVGDTLTFWD